MEETPSSGSTEDINRSQTDLGSLNWGLELSSASVSQEITAGGSLPFPEAEQTSRESTGTLSASVWPAVGEQEDHAPGSSSIDENQRTSLKAHSDARNIPCKDLETDQPLANESSCEMPITGTNSLLDESPYDVKKAEEKKQEEEESVWAGVEPCEKVETRAVNFKEIKHAEEFEETDYENKEHSEVEPLKGLAKRDHEILENTEIETVWESEYNNGQTETTVDNCLEETGLENHGQINFKGVKERDEIVPGSLSTGLEDGANIAENTCQHVECADVEPENVLDNWNRDHETECSDELDHASSVIGGRTAMECLNVMGHVFLDVTDHSEKDTADVGEVLCDAELFSAEESVKETEDNSFSTLQNGSAADEGHADFIPFEKELALQSESADKANAKCSDSGLDNVEVPLVVRAAPAVTEDHSSNVSVPGGALETDPWLANWDPTVNNDPWGFSSLSDGQTNGFDNWPFSSKQQDSEESNMESTWPTFSDKWSTQDLESIDHSWGDMSVTTSNKNQEVSLKQGSSGEQASISTSGPSKEIARPLVLFQVGNSRNASTESSTSPKDNETNNSDLSEDEIANRRYGLLYQEVEADKEEVPTPVCSIV
ncbi:uncharacterized protein ACDP82_003147 [Pangshura tecta]